MSKKRYDQLIGLIAQVKPKTILEIGTWDGNRAKIMAAEALKHSDMVRYLGFDLFESATDETDAEELNVKPHHNQLDVNRTLETFRSDNRGFDFNLVKGNTRETPEPASVDFVFLDGGHSVETIRSDYEAVKGSKVVILDDYYEPDEEGKCPDITKFGCNEIVKGIDHCIMPVADQMPDGGLVKMVAVGIEVGKTNLKIQTRNCVDSDNIVRNVKHALTMRKPFLRQCYPHGRHAVMVASGPSLEEHYDEIKALRKSGALIFSVKSAHHKLIQVGIVPDYCLLLDPRTDVIPWITPIHPDVTYLVASMCHPEVWDHLVASNAKILGYHAYVGKEEAAPIKKAHMADMKEVMTELYSVMKSWRLKDIKEAANIIPEVVRGRFGAEGLMIPGGCTAYIRGIALLHSIGFRNFSLIGADSCYFKKPDMSTLDKMGRPRYLKVTVGKEGNRKQFITDLQLLAQSQDFDKLMKNNETMNLTVYGDGMLAHIWASIHQGKESFDDFMGQVADGTS